ncbi:cathepsin L [Trichonephila clavipes]|nr:cathepsin L [Trichonephila clavipes]
MWCTRCTPARTSPGFGSYASRERLSKKRTGERPMERCCFHSWMWGRRYQSETSSSTMCLPPLNMQYQRPTILRDMISSPYTVCKPSWMTNALMLHNESIHFRRLGENKDSIMLLVIFSLLAITEARIGDFRPSLPNPHPSIQEIIARDPLWIRYKMAHRKHYRGEEDVMRRRIFFENIISALKHNREESKGLKSFRRGINKYSDLTHEEYMKYLNGYRFKPDAIVNSTDWIPLVNIDLPDKVDWREKGLVTPIKDQVRFQ